MDAILEMAGIPILLFIICIFYGVRMIILQDASAIRAKNSKPLKDEKAYAKLGGILMLSLGGASLLMAILVFVNIYAALAEIIVCTIVIGALWKKMNDRYGA